MFSTLKSHRQISKKRCSEKYIYVIKHAIFQLYKIPLTELFRKPDNWRQIHKQASSTFHTSTDVSRRKKYYVMTRLWNCCLITSFKKIQKQRIKVQKQSPKVFCKKVPLKISQTLQENTCAGVFFNKVAGLQSASFIKRDCNTSAFLWSLRNFLEHLFSRTSANGCFWWCSI